MENGSEIPSEFLDFFLQKNGEKNLDQFYTKKKILYGVKEDRNIPLTIKSRKTNWIGETLLRESLLKYIIKNDRSNYRKDEKTRKKT